MVDEGIYPNVPESVYRAHEGISQSELKEFGNAATPLHFKALKPKEATPDMEFGTVCHAAILTPELFDQSYHLQPEEYEAEVKGKKVMKPWHNGADACKEWVKSHSDRPIMTVEKIERVKKIAERIRYIPEVKAALENGMKEVAHLKLDPETGLMMKCRADLMATDQAGLTWIFDFKKVQSGGATHAEFSKSAADYGYFIQAHYYLTVTGASKFVFVPFDDSEPFDACLFEPDRDSLILGYRKWRRLLNDYARCKREDIWPGYPSSIQTLTAPKWMKE